VPGKEQEYVRQLRRITYSLDEHQAGAANERNRFSGKTDNEKEGKT
jgi:hypothetical protein